MSLITPSFGMFKKKRWRDRRSRRHRNGDKCNTNFFWRERRSRRRFLKIPKLWVISDTLKRFGSNIFKSTGEALNLRYTFINENLKKKNFWAAAENGCELRVVSDTTQKILPNYR